jgi:hypothetical protein
MGVDPYGHTVAILSENSCTQSRVITTTMSSEPPAKRQRSESASITRSDIWYEDGSIVLQAHTTQFRVHWGVLSMHSSFFQHMQDLPQPPEPDNVEGCPLVQVSDAVADREIFSKLYIIRGL